MFIVCHTGKKTGHKQYVQCDPIFVQLSILLLLISAIVNYFLLFNLSIFHSL